MEYLQKNLLIISSWWDLSGEGGTSSYSLHLISLIQNYFDKIYYLFPYNKKSKYSHQSIKIEKKFFFQNSVFNIPLYIFLDYNPFFQYRVKKILEMYKIDAIFFLYPWGINSIRRKFPEMKIFHASLDFIWEYSQILFQNLPKCIRNLLIQYSRYLERKAVIGSTGIITISDQIKKQLITQYLITQNKPMCTIKYVFSELKLDLSNRDEIEKKYGLDPYKKKFIFHGGLAHRPNYEAVQIIKNEISPRIYQIDKSICFCIVGKGNENYIDKNVYSYDFIPNIDEFISVMDGAILPIISGTGLRIKVMDYIKNKIPIISTEKGVEGYDFSSNEVIITPNNINIHFINSILQISKDHTLASKLANNCYNKVKVELSIEYMKEKLSHFFRLIFFNE